VVEARLTKDTELFGKMDPYAVITLRETKVRTKTKQNAGKNPKWLEMFDIQVRYIGDDMEINVFDEDVTTSDLVGTAILKVSSLCLPQGLDDWFEIRYKGKKSGAIHLKSSWFPEISKMD
jgi:Ca2+-dependent lipid-binding protein